MDKTPLMVKALCDEDFWNSLSERSGKDWTILAVKPKQGKYYFSSSSPGMFTLMMKIWNEPSDTKVLINELALNDTEDLPIIYFVDSEAGFENTFYERVEGEHQKKFI